MTRSYDELSKPVSHSEERATHAQMAEATSSASLGIKSREPIAIPIGGPERAARAARIKRPIDLGK
jgi:hypothetical protein